MPAGTTRNHLGPLLETSGLRIGQDILLAYSPERVFVGRVLADLRKYPKVVGGVDEASLQRVAAFYEKALAAPVLRMANCETAEFVKLAETTYRDVNIALANELARARRSARRRRDGCNRRRQLPALLSHPPARRGSGGTLHTRVPLLSDRGSGGVATAARRPPHKRRHGPLRRREAGWSIEAAFKGRRSLILGLSYRPNIKEAAYSSTLLLARELAAAGARVLVHDPYYSADEISRFGLEAPTAFPTCPRRRLGHPGRPRRVPQDGPRLIHRLFRRAGRTQRPLQGKGRSSGVTLPGDRQIAGDVIGDNNHPPRHPIGRCEDRILVGSSGY